MAETKNGPELHPQTVELARGANYGSITTMMPGGDFQTQLIWVHTGGERLVVNTEVHRQKFKNVQRDPRVTLTIRNEQDPYHYAEARGRVVETVTGPEAREHIDQLSRKYHGQDYNPDDIKSERVMLWIVPERQTPSPTRASRAFRACFVRFIRPLRARCRPLDPRLMQLRGRQSRLRPRARHASGGPR